MVQLYVNLITQGLWTIDKVPNAWRTQVQEQLNKSNEGA